MLAQGPNYSIGRNLFILVGNSLDDLNNSLLSLIFSKEGNNPGDSLILKQGYIDNTTGFIGYREPCLSLTFNNIEAFLVLFL